MSFTIKTISMYGITNTYTLNLGSIAVIRMVLSCPHSLVNINTTQKYLVLQSKLFLLSRIEKKNYMKNEILGETTILKAKFRWHEEFIDINKWPKRLERILKNKSLSIFDNIFSFTANILNVPLSTNWRLRSTF